MTQHSKLGDPYSSVSSVHFSDEDILAACLTPPGSAALATVALCGTSAWALVRKLYRPRSQPELPITPIPGQLWLGRLGGEVTDEIVLAIRRAGPVAWLELSCHGGPEAVRCTLEALRSEGAAVCSWQQFMRRVAVSPLQSTAAIALAHARTTRAAAILLDQYHGAFERTLRSIQAALDSPDEETAGHLLTELVSYAGVGHHLTTPWRVVLAGAPNVGKSSLLNALAGFQRTVVAPTPGTTRDIVTANLAIEGWPVELVDTAGQRAAEGWVEQHGIDRARAAGESADICLWVLDASVPPRWPENRSANLQFIVNKIDTPPAWNLETTSEAVHVSAQTGAGLEQLCTALARRLVPSPPPPGAGVPFTPALGADTEEALRLVSSGDMTEARQVIERLLSRAE